MSDNDHSGLPTFADVARQFCIGYADHVQGVCQCEELAVTIREAVAAEREACAVIADGVGGGVAEYIAERIRARANP